MRIWRRPIWWFWSAPTSPGAIRCSISASWRPRRRGPTMQVVVDRPAPHRHLRRRGPAPGHCAGLRMSRCSTRFSTTSRRRGADAITTSCRHMSSGFDAAFAAADATDTGTTRAARRPSCRRFLRSLDRHRKGRHGLFAGHQPVDAAAPTRSTRSSTATLRPGGSAGPAWGRSSVTGQPNAMGGREVGGLANMLACHLEIENPGASRTRCRTFWKSPAIADDAGPEGGGDVSRGRATGGSRRSGSSAPIRPSRCPRPTRCRGHCGLRLRRGLGRDRRRPIPRGWPMSCCPQRPGARRTAR